MFSHRYYNFTPKSSYANHYGETGIERVMIIAKVLISTHCIGNINTKIPPINFDTTTNKKLMVYVKYEDNTFYPMYIIYYKDNPKLSTTWEIDE